MNEANEKIKMRKPGICAIVVVMGASTIFLLVIALGVIDTFEEVDDNKELLMVHVVMRHGIRTPADTYPTDPHINDTLYPVGWGQLTNDGKWQMYKIGKYLRKRYHRFLGSYYDPEQYYAQATDVDRTKSSLQMVNAGLWPPESHQIWGPISWQPIPIHSETLSEDMLLLVRKPCAAYHKERDKVMASESVQNVLRENKEVFEEISIATGKEIHDFDDVQDIFSTLQAEDYFNLTLPKWTRGFYPEKMLQLTIFSYVINAYNEKMNRLKGGVLLKKLITDWKNKINGTISPENRKTFLYGGHDSTIANLLSTLNVWDAQLPTYGITVLFELSRDKESDIYGVEIYLRNSTEVAPFRLTIPGCDSFCPLDRLVELTYDVIPDNWDEECKIDDPNYEVPEPGGP